MEFVNSEQEIIDKYGQEFYDKLKNIKPHKPCPLTEEELKACVNFIIYGPGGD